MVPGVGNDPTSGVFQTPANPSQLPRLKLVEVVGVEPTASSVQTKRSPG